MALQSLKLTPDTSLLCPDFDGYKLSSGSGNVKVFNKTLTNGLCAAGESGSASYLHTHMGALHNNLVTDAVHQPTDELNHPTDGLDVQISEASYVSAYCFNSQGQLLSYDYTAGELCDSRVVWQAQVTQQDALPLQLLLPPEIENTGEAITADGSSFRPSLVFAGPSLAVTSDGRRQLNLVSTGDRRPQAHHTWLTVSSTCVGACKVVDARLVEEAGHNSEGAEPNSANRLHVVLVSVAPATALPLTPPTHLSAAPSVHIISWLTLTKTEDGSWSTERERWFLCDGTLEYCYLDQWCTQLVLLAHGRAHLVHDSQGQPVPVLETPKQPQPPQHVYRQTADDVTLRLACDVTGEDVRVVVTSRDVTISRRSNDNVILKGTWQHPVDSDTATWVIDGVNAEVCVSKAQPGVEWEAVLEGSRGEEVGGADNQQCNEEEDKPPYDPGQLESCDDADSDLLLQLLGQKAMGGGVKMEGGATTGGGAANGVVAKTGGSAAAQGRTSANLGNTQYLATIPAGPCRPPLFCLRSDVDGLVWQVTSPGTSNNAGNQSTTRDNAAATRDDVTANVSFQHTATLHAFGYVKASKQMAKFTSAPLDCSYVAVCDVRSHVYLFCRPAPFGGELRNRRTGRSSLTVARQLVLSLPSHEEVMGFVALPHVIILCTQNTVYAYKLQLQEE